MTLVTKHQYRNCSTSLVQQGTARSAGRLTERHGVPGWLDLASCGSTGSIWLPDAPLLPRWGLDWLDRAAPDALAGSIWHSWTPWLVRFGCSDRSWSPWLVVESQKTLSFSTVCLDAACLVRSGTFPHASNLVFNQYEPASEILGITI